MNTILRIHDQWAKSGPVYSTPFIWWLPIIHLDTWATKVGAQQACLHMSLTSDYLTGLKMAIWPKIGQLESPTRELKNVTNGSLQWCFEALESCGVVTFFAIYGEAKKAGYTVEKPKTDTEGSKEAQKDYSSISLFPILGFRIFLKLDCSPELGFPEIPCVLKWTLYVWCFWRLN